MMNSIRMHLLVLLFVAALFQLARGNDVVTESVLQEGDRIMFIGDSITLQGERQWCVMIEQALSDSGRWHGQTIVPVASSGHTVSTWQRLEVRTRTESVMWGWNGRPKYDVGKTLDEGADVLVIMLGMNDVLGPHVQDNEQAYAKWKQTYRELIAALRERCKPRVVGLATPTPCTEDPGSPKNRVMDRLVEEMRALAAEEDCIVMPTRDASWEVLRRVRRVDPAGHITHDRVHPTRYGMWAIAAGMLRGLGETEASDAMLKVAGLTDVGDQALSYWLRAATQDGAGKAVGYRLRVFHADHPVTLELPDGWKHFVEEQDKAKGADVTGSETVFIMTGKPVQLNHTAVIRCGDKTKTVNIPAPWLIGTAYVNRLGWGRAGFNSEQAKLPSDDVIRTGIDFTKQMGNMEAAPNKPVQWQTVTNTIDYGGQGSPHAIDFMQVTYFNSGSVGYGLRWVHSDRDQNARLNIGGQIGQAHVETWLNGRTVYGGNPAKADKAGYPVALKAGWNLLSFKANYLYGQWLVTLELVAPDGSPLPDLRYTAAPPVEFKGIGVDEHSP